MKKLLALLLALIMCVGVFAACGEEKEPAANDPGNTDVPGNTDEPVTPDEPDVDDGLPAVADGYKRYATTIDMTDIYTLVLESSSVTYEDRMGVRAAEGKIECGYYNPVGRRVKGYEFTFADLGLEGSAWEYLGCEVIIDVKEDDDTVYEMVTTPFKSTWCVKASDITFPDTYTLQIPDGTTFDLKIMCYVELMQNFLFNSGMNTMPKWAWFKNCNSSADLLYNDNRYNYGCFVISKIPQYNRNWITDTMAPVHGDLNVNDGLLSVADFEPVTSTSYGEEYVIVANEVRSLGVGEAVEKYTVRVVKKDAYEKYLTTGKVELSEEMILNYADSNDEYLGSVVLVNYNYSDVKYYGFYNTGEKMEIPAQ